VYIILALIKRKDAGESHTNFTSPRKNTTLSSRRSFFLPPIADNRAASDSRDNKQPAANDDSNSKQRAASDASSDDSDHKQRAANRASDDSDSKQPSRKQADKQTAASSREPSNEPRTEQRADCHFSFARPNVAFLVCCSGRLYDTRLPSIVSNDSKQ
jgi:hypothetical protein